MLQQRSCIGPLAPKQGWDPSIGMLAIKLTEGPARGLQAVGTGRYSKVKFERAACLALALAMEVEFGLLPWLRLDSKLSFLVDRAQTKRDELLVK